MFSASDEELRGTSAVAHTSPLHMRRIAECRVALDVVLAQSKAPAEWLESGRADLVSEYATLGRAADADAMRAQLAKPTTPSR